MQAYSPKNSNKVNKNHTKDLLSFEIKNVR